MPQKDLVKFLDSLADAAGEAIMPHFRALTRIDNKTDIGFDPVTVADRNAETAIRDLLVAHLPDHGIVGEEFGELRAGADNVWIIDPIDGTRAFISGLPVWGTLIGLMHRGSPVLGMMAQHFTGERFAGDGQRAWFSGPGGNAMLKTRECSRLADAVLFTTTPSMFTDRERDAYDEIESIVRLPRYGCDCYAYCMVAAGHADLVIEAGLKPYDIVALIPVIEGAGGQVTNWQGGPASQGGRIVASGDPILHEQALAVLSSTPE